MWTITFTLSGVAVGCWLQNKYFDNSISGTVPDSSPTSSPLDNNSHRASSIIDIDSNRDTANNTMSYEVPPGHVGTLTPDEEAKLQELWILLAKVCGIELEGIDMNGNGSSASTSPTADRRKSKRFFGFGRSNGDEDETKAENGMASLSITDGDDKFGQTKDFQKALADIKPEDLRQTFWSMVKQDHPDALLLRFLRARKWDTKKALIMLVSTVRWRLLEIKVDDDIMPNGEALALRQSQSSDPIEKKKGQEFLHQLRMGKSFQHGVDKSGRPITVVRVRLHYSSDQSVEVLERYTVYNIETTRMMLVPPVETAVRTCAWRRDTHACDEPVGG